MRGPRSCRVAEISLSSVFCWEQVLDILMDILSWEIAEVVSPCLPRGLWSHIVIRVFLLLGTVCPRHPPYPMLPSCPLSSAFPYPQPGDAGGCRSAPAVCQSLTSADPTSSRDMGVERRMEGERMGEESMQHDKPLDGFRGEATSNY